LLALGAAGVQHEPWRTPGVQYMVKSVSKGYIKEQGLQKKITEDWDTGFSNLD
jgi:hypothetical protein